MIHPTLRPFVEILSNVGSRLDLVTAIRDACLTSSGYWNVPELPNSDQPVLYEISLFEVDASGLSADEAARNWLKIAKDRIAEDDERAHRPDRKGLGMVMTSLLRASVDRGTSLEKTSIDMSLLILQDMFRVAPSETLTLMHAMSEAVRTEDASGVSPALAPIEAKMARALKGAA